jgi:hypothetical protein
MTVAASTVGASQGRSPQNFIIVGARMKHRPAGGDAVMADPHEPSSIAVENMEKRCRYRRIAILRTWT